MVLYTVFKSIMNKYGFLPCNFLRVCYSPQFLYDAKVVLEMNILKTTLDNDLCNAFLKKKKKNITITFLRDISNLFWPEFISWCIIYGLGIQPKHMYILKSVLHLFSFMHMSSLIGFSLMKWLMRNPVFSEEEFRTVGFFRAVASAYCSFLWHLACEVVFSLSRRPLHAV